MTTTIKTAKFALRKSMKERLHTITAESLATQSQKVSSYVVEHHTYQKSRSIACYLSMPTAEIQTDAIVSTALADGKILYVPRLIKTVSPIGVKSSFMDFFRIHSEADFKENLEAGVWGIREPRETYENLPRMTVFSEGSDGVDLVLMPGMAFDRNLSRLGHGKGYYDKFIMEYKLQASSRGWNIPAFCGLALEEQVLDKGTIPMTETDARLDVLITSTGVIPREDTQD